VIAVWPSFHIVPGVGFRAPTKGGTSVPTCWLLAGWLLAGCVAVYLLAGFVAARCLAGCPAADKADSAGCLAGSVCSWLASWHTLADESHATQTKSMQYQ